MHLSRVFFMQPKIVVPQFTAQKPVAGSPRLISSDDVAQVEKAPDVMRMHLKLEVKAAEKADAYQQMLEKATPLKAAVDALNLPGEQSTQFSVHPDTRWDTEKEEHVPDGHKGRYTLTVEDHRKDATAFLTDAAKLMAVAKEAAVDFDGPFYDLRPDTRKAAEQEASVKAYLNAVQMNQAVAQAGRFNIAPKPVSVIVGDHGISHALGGDSSGRLQAASIRRMTTSFNETIPAEGLFEFKPIPVRSKSVQVVSEIAPDPETPKRTMRPIKTNHQGKFIPDERYR